MQKRENEGKVENAKEREMLKREIEIEGEREKRQGKVSLSPSLSLFLLDRNTERER